MEELSYWYSVTGSSSSRTSSSLSDDNHDFGEYNVRTPSGSNPGKFMQDGLLPTPPEWMKIPQRSQLSATARSFKPSTPVVPSTPLTNEQEVDPALLQALADLLSQSIEACSATSTF
jgi:hypothetical protein